MYDEDEKFEYDFKIEFEAEFENENVPIFYVKQTCFACPETFDFYIHDFGEYYTYIGYLRTRYGGLNIVSCSDESLYNTNDIKGDGMLDYDEREHFIKLACAKLYKNKTKYADKTDQSYFDDEE